MALNREQKRMLRKQGELGDDGSPVATRRQQPAPRTRDERTSPGQFVKEVRGELRKVAWPTRAEVINYSIVVLIALLVLTGLIALIDWGFGEGVLKLFQR